MRRILPAWRAAFFCLALCGVLTACKQREKIQVPEEKAGTETTVGTAGQAGQERQQGQQEISIDTRKEDGAGEPEGADSGSGTAEAGLIKAQTFETELKPLGKVTFASYEPDTSQNPLADARFELRQDGRTIAVLEGMYEGNVRANEAFEQVEAVSFPDYNSDGYNDILILCGYSPVSGPESGSGYSEVRIYSGSEDGFFTLQRDLSDAANSAVAEKTIQSILGFLGAGKKDAGAEAEKSGWKEAYISLLQSQDAGRWDGYQLIYIDADEIPELVEIGNSEATGNRIVSYANGAAEETSLQRLYFTYIERGGLLCNSEGSMDHYYDLVYSMKDGRLSQTASGYYGAEETGGLKFDEKGEPIYQYEWNGRQMSREDYERELNAVYDTSKAKAGYEWDHILSLEDVIKAINEL